jgi:hypothetical protein
MYKKGMYRADSPEMEEALGEGISRIRDILIEAYGESRPGKEKWESFTAAIAREAGIGIVEPIGGELDQAIFAENLTPEQVGTLGAVWIIGKNRALEKLEEDVRAGETEGGSRQQGLF